MKPRRIPLLAALLLFISVLHAQTQHAPTWASDIAPILNQNCSTCHHPGGGGPFSLLTYEDARRWGRQIVTVTQSRYMPPWLPEPGFGDFADQRRLSDHDLAQLRRWMESGMPQGDAALAPPAPQFNPTWQYGKPDLILTIERPFTLSASGTDVFRNFVLPYPLKEGHYIRAMEIRPGAAEIVHHANVLIDRTASFRRTHPDAWRDGVPGMEIEVDAGNSFDPDSHFLFWKPDTPVLVEPDGMPWRLDPGNDLILNMHLKPSGKAETITAQIGLYFTDKPPTHQPMLLQLERDGALDIPAGAANFVVEDQLRLPIDVDLLGIYPHAHYLGKQLEAWAMLPNGQRLWLIRIDDWDIDRQSVYRYREPVRLPKGTFVHMHYVYDNSMANIRNPHSPPIRVRAGNRSEDEMAHLWLQVLPVNIPANTPDPRLILEEAWMRSKLEKDPHDAIALYNLASALQGQARYPEAIAAWRRVLEAHPDDTRAENGLGSALAASGDWQQARQLFTQLTASHPADCDARYNLANLEAHHGQSGEAEKAFRDTLASCPDDAAAHSGLCAVLMNNGQPQPARAECEQALALDAHDFLALYTLGSLDLGEGDTTHALPRLREAVSMTPADIDAEEHLAAAYAQSGQMTEAIRQLRSALALAEDPAAQAQLHSTLAQALDASGDLMSAIAEQKSALHLTAEDADGWNNLGVLEARAGDKAQARQDFLTALKLEPNHAQARANLDRLKQ
ncbi:tetratricopeptide repeat protein [Silvibacterium sp.]|uniref:tetratricopeptide repeat protein n=1 Tax=Silvibacterium sp. TaxID=1964179 RepID=UPI0039E3A4E1